jgi:hypothetical protein
MRSLDSIACGDPGARATGRGLGSLGSLCSLFAHRPTSRSRRPYDDHTMITRCLALTLNAVPVVLFSQYVLVHFSCFS